MPHPSETYALELSSRKQGYPLWVPEPEPQVEGNPQPHLGKVRIGDVGYIHEGRFRKLFNVTEERNVGLDSYKPLVFDESLLVDKVKQALRGPLYSETTELRKIDLEAGADAQGLAGAGLGYMWDVAQTDGALLILQERGADSAKIPSNKVFADYLKKNYDSWCRYASDKGFSSQNLFLARGHVMTNCWAVAAFHSSSSTHKASAKATFQLVEGKFELSKGHEHHSPVTSRSGSSSEFDQCVFLPHYRCRRRFFGLGPNKIEAQAGPHQLPGGPRDDEGGSPVPVTDAEATDEAPPERIHPLDVVLDYILGHSNAEIAIACEDDISGLFLDAPWPQDLRTWLDQHTPRIDVEDGLGTLSLEAAINKRHLYDIRKAGRTWQENAMDVDDDALTGPPNPDAPEDLIIGDGSLVLGRRQPQGPSMQWYHLSMSDKEAEGGSVSSISLAPDGDRAVTGSDDGYVRLWNVKTGQMLEKWEGHEDNVWSVMYSPDGSKIISGSADAKIIVWDPALEGEEALVQQLEEHSQDVWAVVYSPDGSKFASGSVDCTVKIWDAESYEVIHTLGGHSPNVMNVGWTPDGKRLVSCADSVGRVWDVENGELLRTLRGHTASIWSMCISKDGERVVTGSEDHTSRIWSTETGDELVTMHEHTGPVWAVAFSPDDREVASGSYDCTVVTNDSFTGERHHVFSGRSSIVDSVAYSANGKYLFSGAADGNVWMWDREGGTMLAEMQGHKDKVKNLVFSKDNRDLYTASEDGSVRVWSLRDIVRVL